MKVSAAETLDLPISERIQLVTEIWDSIAKFPDEIELTPLLRRETCSG
jgi:putative addiction module component (TIGR02574 family)